MAATYKLTPHETVTVVRSDPDALEVEAEYGPSGKPPPPHLHPAQDEHFEVLAGELTARLDGGPERKLHAGEAIDIPRGTKHQMWNAAAAEARVRWETKPGGRTEEWFRSVDRLVREAGGGMPGPLAFGPLIDEYRDTFRLAVGPDWAVGPAMKALGAVGRLRGRNRPQ
jgi:quercetin dioxygenase-like cupin family protein